MFGFIKNLFKPKTFKEAKQEYKEVKAKLVARAEDVKGLENEYIAARIESEIRDCCFGCLRPEQEDCPPLIIYNYKKLLEIANDEALVRATDNLGRILTKTQQQDFMNKVRQLKEYKEWRMNKKIKELEEDFKDE